MKVLLKILLFILGLNISLFAFDQNMTEELKRHPYYEDYLSALNSGQKEKAMEIKIKAAKEITDIVLKKFSLESMDIKRGKKQAIVADKILRWHKNTVNHIVFAPNSKSLISSSLDGSIKEWDISKEVEKRILYKSNTDTRITSLAYSNNGKYIVFSIMDVDGFTKGYSPYSIFCLNLETNKIFKLYDTTNRISDVVFLNDSETIVSVGYDKTIRIFNILTKNSKTINVSNYLLSVAVSPDAKIIVCGYYDSGKIDLYDFKSGKKITTLGHYNSNNYPYEYSSGWAVKSIEFSPDGKYFATGSEDKTVKIWDIGILKEIKMLLSFEQPITSVAFSPNGKYLALGSNDEKIAIFDTVNWTKINDLEGHVNRIESIAFSLDNLTIAAGSADKTIMIWDMKKIEQLK